MESPTPAPDRGGAEQSDDDAVSTPFVRAGRHCAKHREQSGSDECTLAERVAAHGDRAHCVAREALLAGLGLDCNLIAREAREAPGDLAPRLILNLKLIVKVDPKREVFKRLKHLGPALRRCR